MPCMDPNMAAKGRCGHDGSTEREYEPPYGPKEVPPKYQCSPSLHRCKLEWGGSDPAIRSIQLKFGACDTPQITYWLSVSVVKYEKAAPLNQRSNLWLESQKELQVVMSALTRDDRVKEMNSHRTQADPPAQDGETAADKEESIHTTGRLKRLQNLVQAKKAHQSGAGRGKRTSENDDHLADVSSNNNSVLSCIGLGMSAENKPSTTTTSPQRQRQLTSGVYEDSEEEGLGYQWNPFECPQPWTPFYHTCRQPHHELPVCSGTLSLPRTTEWDRFESLIQELDRKHSDLSSPEMIRSITVRPLPQNTLSQEQKGDSTAPRLQRREAETLSRSDRKHAEASPEKEPSAITTGNTQKNETERGKAGRRPFSNEQGRSSNSLESLFSLNSGQSTSSGVTSGSGCSSNRDSLRLEDELLCTRRLGGRAKVHTDFMPSPYDTESLKLQVGDVIDIIAKPSMGIWTGTLNGRTGNFKFIYVDVLTEESPHTHMETQSRRVRQKSTVHEVLKRLSMELNGYQTVADLKRLREHHLTELNVTDPEQRLRLLSAVRSLQQLRSDSQLENKANQGAETPGENMKADKNNCPRDSGCHMPSVSPDNSPEDTDLHFISQYPLPAETAAS
ncbi:SAM and SH3 domain-containing protein 3 [Liparis tanakae]|uniref:SAM and SH3 domain-containing protein 3 n=1 Tax=Liparis tanakae TaxID=230148 RepID=A0A4Z2HCJ8_9TELE|nr:SAM and SH3 domain-containing protein 3 [Liparis tanakae]